MYFQKMIIFQRGEGGEKSAAFWGIFFFFVWLVGSVSFHFTFGFELREPEIKIFLKFQLSQKYYVEVSSEINFISLLCLTTT